MALGEIDIKLSDIKTELEASTENLGLLCIDDSVNMWSRKKPVRQHNTTPADWYKAIDGNFGLNLTDVEGSLISVAYPPGPWERVLPNDLWGYRIGDFRGYDESQRPFMYMQLYQTANVNLLASDKASFLLKTNHTTIGISMSDFSEDYSRYFTGIRLSYGANEAFMTGDTSISTGVQYQLDFDLDAAPFSGTLGTYYWSAFICDGCISGIPVLNPNIDYDFDCLLCPSTYVPGIGYTPNSGSFTVVSQATVEANDVSIYTDQGEWYDPETSPSANVENSAADWYMTMKTNIGGDVALSELTFNISEALDEGVTPGPYNLATASGETWATSAGNPISFNIDTWSNDGGLMTGPLGPTEITFTIKQGTTTIYTGTVTATVPEL